MSVFSQGVRSSVAGLDLFQEHRRGRHISIDELESESEDDGEAMRNAATTPAGSFRYGPPTACRRFFGKARRGAILGEPHMQQHLLERLLRLDHARRPMDAKESEARPRYKAEVPEISREGLYAQVVRDITPFWKARGHEEWRTGGLRALQRLVREVVGHSRAADALAAEVECVLRLRRLARQPDRGDETPRERSGRTADFFERYRARAPCEAAERSSEAWRSRAQANCRASGALARAALSEDPVRTPEVLRAVRRRPFTSELEEVEVAVATQVVRRTQGEGRASSRASRFLSQRPEDLTVTFWAQSQSGATRQLRRKAPELRARADPPPGSQLSRLPPLGSACTLSSAGEERVLRELPLIPPDGGIVLPGMAAPQRVYLHACHSYGVVPLANRFVTGHTAKLRVQGLNLEDRDMRPLIAMAEHLEELEEVDLRGSSRLTAASLVPFIKAISETNDVSSHMVRLSLNGCSRAGAGVVAALQCLLAARSRHQPCLYELQELDLTSVRITPKQYLPLASALGRHASLRSVVLADTGLGVGAPVQTCMVFTDLLRVQALEVLDISWSTIDAEVFAHLGERLPTAKVLHTLHISGCCRHSTLARDFPVEHFLERLSHAVALTRLDVSLNSVDWRGALVMEDALESQAGFRDLNVSDNPLGVSGLRSLLRLLGRDSSGLLKLQMEKCAKGSFSPGEEDTLQAFSITNPRGRFALDLARPYNRGLLRMLLKSCERFSLSPKKAFDDVDYAVDDSRHGAVVVNYRPSGGGAPTFKKDARGVWVVPKQGRLSFTFHQQWQGKGKKAVALADVWDFRGFLKSHSDFVRMRPAFDKVVPLFAHWQVLSGRNSEQEALLDALATDFDLTYPQLRELARSRELTNEVICRMLHCVTGGRACHFLSLLLTPTPTQYVRNYARLRNFLGFNADNPTWQYRLNLEVPSDFVVAEQLFLLDRWEVEIDVQLGRPDTSQHGYRTHMRNIVHAGRTVQVKSITEWCLPTCDILTFDYSSGKRAPEDAVGFDDVTFSKVLSTLHSTALDPETKLEVLRWISHWVFCRALQMREFLAAFSEAAHRANLFVLLFFRIVDMHHEKLFRVRFDNPQEIEELQHRLGIAAFFPFIQPERSNFKFDFQYNDHRLMASSLLQLAFREQINNLRYVSFVDPHSRTDPLLSGVPRSWEDPAKLPSTGILRASYFCAPELRCFAQRKLAFERFGFWKLLVQEKGVSWWTGLAEIPPDVQVFMEWVVRNYQNCDDPFRALMRRSGQSVVNLVSFQDGLRDIGFDLFDHDEGRTQALFRFFDDDGQGAISELEWQVVGQLHQEMMVSLEEFVKFLRRTFTSRGKDEFLDEAWETLDRSRDGEVEHEEWRAALTSLKYFGPSDLVFHFLDRNNNGQISPTEFKILQRFVHRVN